MVAFVNIAASQKNGNKRQLTPILNQVEKQKGFVYQSAGFSADKKSILIEIRPRSGSRPICDDCGTKGSGSDSLPARHFEFVPLWGMVVYFMYAMRRELRGESGAGPLESREASHDRSY